MSNVSLPPELVEIENALSNLVPSALSPDLVDELAGSLDDQSDVCLDDEGLNDLERHLDQISPTTMRTDVLARMIKAMDSWHEHVPVEEKVVAFKGQQTDQPELLSKSSRGMWAAAATVALLGAVTALMLPVLSPGDGDSVVENQVPVNSGSPDLYALGKSDTGSALVASDTLSHRVINTADRGIVMSGNEMPHRCIRLDGMETIKLEDENGREVTIDRPSVQYVLIPVHTN